MGMQRGSPLFFVINRAHTPRSYRPYQRRWTINRDGCLGRSANDVIRTENNLCAGFSGFLKAADSIAQRRCVSVGSSPLVTWCTDTALEPCASVGLLHKNSVVGSSMVDETRFYSNDALYSLSPYNRLPTNVCSLCECFCSSSVWIFIGVFFKNRPDNPEQ